MQKINFVRTLAEATKQDTRKIARKSPRTGNMYETDCFDAELIVLGAPEERVKTQEDGTAVTEYAYSVYDSQHDLGYIITAPTKLATGSFTKVIFHEVTGGPVGTNSSWFKAKSVELPKKGA